MAGSNNGTRRGRTAGGTSATRARSLKVSLSATQGRSVTIQLDNPDDMINKVVEVLSARFPVEAFFDAVTPSEETSSHGSSAPMITSLEQALRRPDEVARILPPELQADWLRYVSRAGSDHDNGVHLPAHRAAVASLMPTEVVPVVSRVIEMPRQVEPEGAFDDQGKWEVWNDDLADEETEHSKSGSASNMDDSSFHDSQAAGPIPPAHRFRNSPQLVPQMTSVPRQVTPQMVGAQLSQRVAMDGASEHTMVVGGHTQLAETLASFGCLADVVRLPADVSASHPVLVRVAEQVKVDTETLRVMVALIHARSDFRSWCLNLVGAHVQAATFQQDRLSGVMASATMAGSTFPPQTGSHSLMAHSGEQYRVQRQVAGPSQQSLEVSNAAMTVQTTVTVNPTLMDGHVAQTTTTLLKKGTDARPVGAVTVSSPVASPVHDYTLGASPITAHTVASPSNLVTMRSPLITQKADVTPLGATSADQTILISTKAAQPDIRMVVMPSHTADTAPLEDDRASVLSASPVGTLSESPLARLAQNTQAHVLIDPLTHPMRSPLGNTSTRSSHAGVDEDLFDTTARQTREDVFRRLNVSAYRYPLRLSGDIQLLLRENSELLTQVVHHAVEAAEVSLKWLFHMLGLPLEASEFTTSPLSRLTMPPVPERVSTVVEMLKEASLAHVLKRLVKLTRQLHETHPSAVHMTNFLNTFLSNVADRINLSSTVELSQFVEFTRAHASDESSQSEPSVIDAALVADALVQRRLGTTEHEHQMSRFKHATVLSSGFKLGDVIGDLVAAPPASQKASASSVSAATHHTVELATDHSLQQRGIGAPPPGVQTIRTIVHPVGYTPPSVAEHRVTRVERHVVDRHLVEPTHIERSFVQRPIQAYAHVPTTFAAPTLAPSPLAAARPVMAPLTVLPRSDLGPQGVAMTTPASFVRSQSPLARNIGHEHLFAGANHITAVPRDLVQLDAKVGSSYVAYPDWKARTGIDVDLVHGAEMTRTTLRVGDLQVNAGGSLTPAANVMPASLMSPVTGALSPLMQLHKENPNAILSHLAQHWSAQSVDKEGSVSTRQ